MRRILLQDVQGGVFVTKKVFVVHEDGSVITSDKELATPVEDTTMASLLITVEDFAEGAKRHD